MYTNIGTGGFRVLPTHLPECAIWYMAKLMKLSQSQRCKVATESFSRKDL